MPEAKVTYALIIFSNDGQTILHAEMRADGSGYFVTATGYRSGYGDIVWTYSGERAFAGFATTANATTATVVPGDELSVSTKEYYVVETDPKRPSKIVFGTETLIDLTSDTVTPETLIEGTTAHDKAGASIVGTNPYALTATNATVDEQAGLIEQIQAELDSLSSGGGGGGGGGAVQKVTVTVNVNGVLRQTGEYEVGSLSVILDSPVVTVACLPSATDYTTQSHCVFEDGTAVMGGLIAGQSGAYSWYQNLIHMGSYSKLVMTIPNQNVTVNIILD